MSKHNLSEHSQDDTPFHHGERAAQQRFGLHEKLDERGRHVIRDFMLDQHREFFAQLPFLIVGSVDRAGQPWASVLVGRPGFVSSPTEHRLDVQAQALHADPLHDALHVDASLGLLGIEPHTRRRNRANGTLSRVTENGFSLEVKQSYGNCPKYIQARILTFCDDVTTAHEKIVHRGERLDKAMRHMVKNADTFFIATAFEGDGAEHGRRHGADVSHRGGKPGFVRIDDDKTLTVPDFVGNFYFNTIGNIIANPRAGLLFIDYANGDLVYLGVDAEIIWDGNEVKSFNGAQRLLRFHIRQAVRVEASLPLRWGDVEFSPMLERIGAWEIA